MEQESNCSFTVAICSIERVLNVLNGFHCSSLFNSNAEVSLSVLGLVFAHFLKILFQWKTSAFNSVKKIGYNVFFLLLQNNFCNCFI